jgi:PAS domain S-box-containing protein
LAAKQAATRAATLWAANAQDPALDVLSQALAASPSAAVVADRGGWIRYVNPGCVQMSGYSATELLTANLAHLALGSSVESIIFETVTSGNTWHGRMPCRRKNGEPFEASTFIAPIRDADGTIAYYLAILEEVPQSATEPRPQFPPDRSPDMVLVVDLDGTILFVNRTVPGISREEATGSSVFQYVPPDHHERLRGYIARVIQTRTPITYEIPSTGPHGTISSYVTQVGPIIRDGRVVALSFITADITPDRDHAREVETRHRLFSEASTEAIIVHQDGVIIDANHVFSEMFGRDKSDALGRPLEGLFAPRANGDDARPVPSGEAAAVRSDGSIFPVETCAKSMLLDGRLVGVLIVRDVRQPQERPRRPQNPTQRRFRAPPKPPPKGAARAQAVDLSAREVEVLELLARGLTNRAVAARLQLSPRTIDHHVSSLLRKLGTPNRTAAAMAAGRARLLARKLPQE